MADLSRLPIEHGLDENRLEAVDRLLRDHFKAEMPAAWPEWSAPVSRAPVRPAVTWRRGRLYRSRWALAASLLLLLLGYFGIYRMNLDARALYGPGESHHEEATHRHGSPLRRSPAALPGQPDSTSNTAKSAGMTQPQAR